MNKKRFLTIVISIVAILAVMCGALACGPSENEAKQLTKPGTLAVDLTTNEFSWAAVQNATGYKVQFDNETTWSNLITELKTEIPEANLTVGTHKARVKAIGDGTNYTDSGVAEKEYTVEQPDPEKLTKPVVTVNTAEKTLTWPVVANAVGYKMQKDAETTWTALVVDTDITIASNTVTYSLADLTLVGTYKFKVMAIAETDSELHLDSDPSEEATYTLTEALLAPTGLDITDGVLTWDVVDNATGYKVQVNSASETGTWSALLTVRTYSLDALQLAEGTYTVKVMAIGNGTTYTDSAAAEIQHIVLPPEPLEMPALFINGDTLSWEQDPNASDYLIQICPGHDGDPCDCGFVALDSDHLTFNEVTLEYSYVVVLAEYGTYYIKIKALGNLAQGYADSPASNMITYKYAEPIDNAWIEDKLLAAGYFKSSTSDSVGPNWEYEGYAYAIDDSSHVSKGTWMGDYIVDNGIIVWALPTEALDYINDCLTYNEFGEARRTCVFGNVVIIAFVTQYTIDEVMHLVNSLGFDLDDATDVQKMVPERLILTTSNWRGANYMGWGTGVYWISEDGQYRISSSFATAFQIDKYDGSKWTNYAAEGNFTTPFTDGRPSCDIQFGSSDLLGFHEFELWDDGRFICSTAPDTSALKDMVFRKST